MGYPSGFPGSCPACGTLREVSGTYDAVLCPVCDEWQSPSCGRCSACRERPARPSEAGDLDLAPHEVDPGYDLDTDDDAELRRRVVLPVVTGTLPAGAVRETEILRLPGTPAAHWPQDLPVPDDVCCRLTFSSGEQCTLYLAAGGLVEAEWLADQFAGRLEDDWCETSFGWGQQLRAVYVVPPRL